MLSRMQKSTHDIRYMTGTIKKRLTIYTQLVRTRAIRRIFKKNDAMYNGGNPARNARISGVPEILIRR